MTGIIKIYKSEANTLWRDDQTFLCVYDHNNHIIADYDFYTDLKIMQNDETMTIYIADADLVPGRWVFSGKTVSDLKDPNIGEFVTAHGLKRGDPFIRTYKNNNPWRVRPHGKYVLVDERESRLDICKGCPLFDQISLKCKDNEVVVLESTKHQDAFCPQEKWGIKFQPIPDPLSGIPEDQVDFESELDKYLEGI